MSSLHSFAARIPGPPQPSLTPPTIPSLGLKFWMKADTLLGLGDGGLVSPWSDSSGSANDATQPTVAHRPVLKVGIINGRPAVRFNGVNTSLAFPNAISAQMSTFVVASVNVVASSQIAYAPFICTQQSRLLVRTGSGTNWGTFTGSDQNSGEDLVAGQWNILGMDCSNAAALFLYRNGVQIFTSGATEVGTAGNVIGAETNTSRWINADIAEIIIYTPVQTRAIRQVVEDYLSRKYKIAVTH